MTDAREIIAQHICGKAGQDWTEITAYERAAYRTAAHGMIEAISAAGFRILGPDEVDPVTLQKAADTAREAYSDSCDWDYFSAADAAIVSAIRAIGRKT